MNIVHIAWLGGQNFGDDLMADMVWGELRKHDPDLHVTIWSHDKPFPRQGTSWIYRNIPHFIFALGFLSRFFRHMAEKRALRNADMLLIGGGTVLHSMNSIGWKYDAAKGIVEFTVTQKQDYLYDAVLEMSVDGEQVSVVSELRGDSGKPAATLDVDLLGPVHENVADAHVAEQRLDWAESRDFV